MRMHKLAGGPRRCLQESCGQEKLQQFRKHIRLNGNAQPAMATGEGRALRKQAIYRQQQPHSGLANSVQASQELSDFFSARRPMWTDEKGIDEV